MAEAMGEDSKVENSLEWFLRSREIPEETIRYFKDQNIDISAIQIMEEETLQQWVPRYGDRLALRDFCKKQLIPKKLSLIEKLREKVMAKNSKISDKDNVAIKTKVTRKRTRKIEIGWMVASKNKLHQLRTSQGGGTRQLDIERSATGYQILEHAKRFFFPNGNSVRGPIEDFSVELLDFKSNKIDLSLTVVHFFNATGFTRVRFYLCTTPLNKENHQNKDGELCSPKRLLEYPFLLSDSSDEGGLPFTNSTKALRNNPPFVPRHSDEEEPSFWGASISNQTDIPQDLDVTNSAAQHTEQFNQDINMLSTSHTLDVQDNNIIFELDVHDIYNLPEIPNSPQHVNAIEKLILHRGHIFKELIEAIQIRDIDLKAVQVEMILPNGKPEQAEDTGGVLRDCISEFFNTFYEMCTMGAQLKVPTLRHDLQEEEWTAIGKIIAASYLSEGYFPIRIAPVFIKNCLGEEVADEEVIENFLKYISCSASVLLKSALENFEDVDSDELLEFCSNYDAHYAPNKENLKKMIIQIAKEELIQKPSFVKECFCTSLRNIKNNFDLSKIYSTLQPTDKNIISCLKINENLSPEEKQVVSYLKKYVKECDQKTRSSFLRFCTGSDLVIGKINIEFNISDGFGRMPVAHTCSGILKIPTTYENFMTFRTEFNNLLNSNVWVMDIV